MGGTQQRPPPYCPFSLPCHFGALGGHLEPDWLQSSFSLFTVAPHPGFSAWLWPGWFSQQSCESPNFGQNRTEWSFVTQHPQWQSHQWWSPGQGVPSSQILACPTSFPASQGCACNVTATESFPHCSPDPWALHSEKQATLWNSNQNWSQVDLGRLNWEFRVWISESEALFCWLLPG